MITWNHPLQYMGASRRSRWLGFLPQARWSQIPSSEEVELSERGEVLTVVSSGTSWCKQPCAHDLPIVRLDLSAIRIRSRDPMSIMVFVIIVLRYSYDFGMEEIFQLAKFQPCWPKQECFSSWEFVERFDRSRTTRWILKWQATAVLQSCGNSPTPATLLPRNQNFKQEAWRCAPCKKIRLHKSHPQ